MKNGAPAEAGAADGPVEEARDDRDARRPQRSGDAFGEKDGGVDMMLTNEDSRAAGRYGAMNDRERDDLVRNLIGQLAQCSADIREHMLGPLEAYDRELGQRVASGIRMMRSLVDVSV